MGLKVKSLRNENDPLTFKIDDIDFNISFDNIEKEIKLDEKSLILLENAIFNDGKIVKNKKKIVMGDYTVKLNSSLEVNNLWLKAFDKLLEFMDKVYSEKFSGFKDKRNYLVTDSISLILYYINNYL